MLCVTAAACGETQAIGILGEGSFGVVRMVKYNDKVREFGEVVHTFTCTGTH